MDRKDANATNRVLNQTATEHAFLKLARGIMVRLEHQANLQDLKTEYDEKAFVCVDMRFDRIRFIESWIAKGSIAPDRLFFWRSAEMLSAALHSPVVSKAEAKAETHKEKGLRNGIRASATRRHPVLGVQHGDHCRLIQRLFRDAVSCTRRVPLLSLLQMEQ
jgi:hypothetical protein